MSDGYPQDAVVLDRILRSRRTTRRFTAETPSREAIGAVVEAGRLAPYAGLANKGTVDFRRFFVLSSTSGLREPIRELAHEAVARKLAGLGDPLDPRMQPMLAAMRGITEKGLPPWTAPWLVIVAERKGYPERESQALAHCLENMWLEATALGLGFQMVSALSDLSGEEAMCRLLDLPTDAFEFDACQIGCPDEPPRVAARQEPDLSVRWLE